MWKIYFDLGETMNIILEQIMTQLNSPISVNIMDSFNSSVFPVIHKPILIELDIFKCPEYSI